MRPVSWTLLIQGNPIPIDARPLIIGRGERCHVMLDDALVSRQHAKVWLQMNRVFVDDLNSRNGVFVNHTRITRPTALHDGDRVLIGPYEASVFLGAFGDDDARAPDDARVTVVPPRTVSCEMRAVTTRSDEDVPSAQDPSSGPAASTHRDMIEMVGIVVRRLLDNGYEQRARSLLFSEIETAIRKSQAGCLEFEDLTALADLCLNLEADYHLHGQWLDAVLHLFIGARTVMAAATARRFANFVAVSSCKARLLIEYQQLINSLPTAPGEAQARDEIRQIPASKVDD